MDCTEMERNHRALVRSGLAECTVLLRSSGAFPLEAPCALAAYGSGVRHTVKGGSGSGEVNSRSFTTVEQGLQAAGFRLTSGAWLDAYDAILEEKKKAFVRQVRAEARAAGQIAAVYGMGKVMPEPEYVLPLRGEGEAAVYVLSRLSGEGNDRMPDPGDVQLTETEKRDIRKLNGMFPRFMLVINAGGPVDLSPLPEVDNILVLSQLGPDTGNVLADILLGRENPSGKLTTTWNAWKDSCGTGDFGDRDETHYREGIYVGYRWYNANGKTPMFPFGFGLSYTTFDLQPGKIGLAGSRVTAAARVTNTGSRPGKEVVQLYCSAPWGRLDKPVQELAGFAKTGLLQPGESRELEITFDMRDMTSFDTARCAYVLEAGRYVLRMGSSSADTCPVGIIRLEEEITVRQVHAVAGDCGFEDWRPAKPAAELLPEGMPELIADPGAIPTETPDYGMPEIPEPAVQQLTENQLILGNIGAFDPVISVESMVGSAGRVVAGSAGDTPCALRKQGFPTLAMADGPAGLRLSPEFYRDSKGVHALGSSGQPSSMMDYLAPPLRWLAKQLTREKKLPADAVRGTQYCTMIPIGTALAQSWNTDYARTCGDVVGREMECYGVTFWLAPALNIHRSILCGRNFEYYSEDPVLSGKFAAALTRGVQSHPGRAATIKHFCCNNQEFNRNGNSSMVSERALREIYLKGFGLCIREAQPWAVMSSYNLVNGVHAAENRGLCTDVLRAEFGFNGLLMTDWVIGGDTAALKGKYRPARAQYAAAAGNDLFMPGSPGDVKKMKKGLKEGTLTRRQLETNVSHVYRVVNRLDKEQK